MRAIADLARKMADAGASGEMIALAIEALVNAAGADEDQRARDDDRRRRDRERKARVRAMSADIPRTKDGQSAECPPVVSPEVSPKDNNQTPFLPPSMGISARAQAETPSSLLAPTIGAEMAAEVVDHRRRMRRPLTAGSAKRLAAKFALCAEPAAAAKAMIDRGWQGFEPEWLSDNPARAGPPNAAPFGNRLQKPSIQDVARNLVEQFKSSPDGDLFAGEGREMRSDSIRLLSSGRR